MKKMMFLLLAAAIGVALAGCVNAKGPESVSIGDIYSSPPPAASAIPKAAPNDAADLRRENDQLRQRLAYMENQIRKSDKKVKDLDADIKDIQADMQKIAAERDRYKKAAGQ